MSCLNTDCEKTYQERDSLEEERDSLVRELREARTIAYCLAHAYDHDTRPPEHWLATARAWGPDT